MHDSINYPANCEQTHRVGSGPHREGSRIFCTRQAFQIVQEPVQPQFTWPQSMPNWLWTGVGSMRKQAKATTTKIEIDFILLQKK